MSGPNTEQAEYWEDRAPSWLEAEGHIARVSMRFGELAMERLDLAAGQRVLDIGCGSGPTSLALAEQVGPDGEVVGADIAPAMLAAARARAADAGARNVRFVTADMQVDDLGAGMFDAAFSQFGVMFFNDPVAAFTNIRRTIHPGGPLAFACWQPIFSNEWMLVPGSAVVTVTGALPSMPGPGEPGPFSLSEPGRIEEVLDGAGFTHVDVVPHDEVRGAGRRRDRFAGEAEPGRRPGAPGAEGRRRRRGPAPPPDRGRRGRGASSASSTARPASAPAPSSSPPARDYLTGSRRHDRRPSEWDPVADHPGRRHPT